MCSKWIRYITFNPLLLSLIIVSSVTPVASSFEPAEENLVVTSDIPPIAVGNDTVIDLLFEDCSGINWTKWIEKSGGLVMITWPLLGFRDIACYHTIEFHARVEGPDGRNLSGWYAIVKPSKVEKSTQGHRAKLKLIVRIDGMTNYPKATVVIKVVRKGRGGAILGVTEHRIKVKAEHIYMVDIRPEKTILEVAPGSLVSVPVTITNMGNYVETFIVVASGEKGARPLFNGQVITLDPGESTKIHVDVSVPLSLFDLGTPRSIEVKVYPVGKEDVAFIAGVSIISKGVSVVVFPIYALVAILVFVLIKFIFTAVKTARKMERERKKEEEIAEKSPKPKRSVNEGKERATYLKESILNAKISQILKEQEKQKRKLNI